MRSTVIALAVLTVAVGIGLAVRSAAAGPARPAQASDEVDGWALYRVQCAGCHGMEGTGIEGRGPSLVPEGEAAADFVLRTGRMPLAAPDRQATAGQVRYSEAEIRALVAVVGEIGDGPDIPAVEGLAGDVARGGELYRLNCAACHVASGAGAPIGGGRIAPNLVGSTPTEVAEAIVVGPGSMPVFAAFTLEQMADVAAYVDELDEQEATGLRSFGGAGPAAEGLAALLLGLVPLIAVTRWIGRPAAGRDEPVGSG